MADIPPPPSGFTLDQPSKVPPPPPGFTLDAAKSVPFPQDQPGVEYGEILPFAKDTATGKVSPAVPEIIRAPLRGMISRGQDLMGVGKPPGDTTTTPDELAAVMVGAPEGSIVPSARRPRTQPQVEPPPPPAAPAPVRAPEPKPSPVTIELHPLPEGEVPHVPSVVSEHEYGAPEQPPPPPGFVLDHGNPSEPPAVAPRETKVSDVDITDKGGPLLEPPTGTEAPAEAAQRVDDSLFRVGMRDMADKTEGQQFIHDLPPEQQSPEFQQRVYDEIEQRMVDPKAPYSPEVQAFVDGPLKPWREEETALVKNLIDRGAGPDVQMMEEGYIHRVRRDAAPGEPGPRDPIMGSYTRRLSTFASGLQKREPFYVLEDAEGNRVWQNTPPEGWEPGETRKGTDGVSYTLKPAMTAEIEQHTNVRYYHNAAINTVENVIRLRRVKRNLDLLDELKQQLLDKDLAFSSGGNRDIPENFIETTLPEFKDWKLDPHIAHVLNDFHGQILAGDDFDKIMAAANRFLTGALFWQPITHIINTAAFAVMARGWDWISPSGWKSLAIDMPRAIKSVITQDELQKAIMREGGALQYPRTLNANFYKLMVEKFMQEQVDDPATWAGIARDLGFSTLKDMIKWEYKASSKALWATSDMFLTQRVLELMRKGMPLRAAIHKAELDIPNYRVPSQIMGTRWVADFLKNRRYLMFPSYTYAKYAIPFRAIKSLIRPAASLAERNEALGKLLVLSIMGYYGYKLGTMAVQQITGNPNADVRLPGPLSAPQAVVDLTTGQKDLAGALMSLISLAPAQETLFDTLRGRDQFGRPLVQPGSSALGLGLQTAESFANRFGPAQTVIGLTKPGGPAREALRPVGARVPTPASQKYKARSAAINRRSAARRERNDPIEQFIRGLIDGAQQ